MYTSCLYRYTHIYIYIWARNSIMNYLHGWNQNISGGIFIIFVQKSVLMQTEKIYLIRFTFEMILWFLYILPDEREIYVNLLSRETERERERERDDFFDRRSIWSYEGKRTHRTGLPRSLFPRRSSLRSLRSLPRYDRVDPSLLGSLRNLTHFLRPSSHLKKWNEWRRKFV